MKFKLTLCLIAALNAFLAFAGNANAATISGGSLAKAFGSELGAMESVDNEEDSGGGEAGDF